MAGPRDGWMTIVVRYEDYDEFRKTDLFKTVFDLAKVEAGPVRVSGISHDDEMTRAELFRDAVEKHHDRYDLEDAVEQIEQAQRVRDLLPLTQA